VLHELCNRCRARIARASGWCYRRRSAALGTGADAIAIFQAWVRAVQRRGGRGSGSSSCTGWRSIRIVVWTVRDREARGRRGVDLLRPEQVVGVVGGNGRVRSGVQVLVSCAQLNRLAKGVSRGL
jgi:hypothetical protein